jgi:hypothetical protein
LYSPLIEAEITMTRVLANAVVDVLKPATPTHIGHFKVEVWGQPPYDYVRTYEIQAKSDTVAAQSGIARFVKEMEALPQPEEN